jgi:hypothetical protein
MSGPSRRVERMVRRAFGRWHWHEIPEAMGVRARVHGHRHVYLVPHRHAELEEAPMATA